MQRFLEVQIREKMSAPIKIAGRKDVNLHGGPVIIDKKTNTVYAFLGMSLHITVFLIKTLRNMLTKPS